jgi:hypothetical protein
MDGALRTRMGVASSIAVVNGFTETMYQRRAESGGAECMRNFINTERSGS